MTDTKRTTQHAPWRNRPRTLWRKYIKRQWQNYQWPVLGGLTLIALALGYIGFGKYFATIGEPRSGWDLFYYALQLFTLESGSASGQIPPELQLARLLAPFILTYTAAKALVVIFREQLQLVRVRFIKNHVVVCGLGQKGLLLVKGFYGHGYRTVVIDQDEENSQLESCRELGAIILVGNATDKELLRKARAQEARYLFSVCGDDGTNAEVAVHTRELVRRRKTGVLTGFVHITNLELANLLREKEITAQKADAFRLGFFNVFASGARAMLNEYPVFSEKQAAGGYRPLPLVVGLGRLGESLLMQMAKTWQTGHPQSAERLRIRIIDGAAEEKRKLLSGRCPPLDRICEVDARQIEVQSPEFQQARFLYDADGCCDVTAIYICLSDDSRALSAALALRQHLRGHTIPIVVRMTHDAGLATLLQGEGGSTEGFDNLHAFGLLDRTCTPDLLLGGTNEVLARAIHENYVRKQRDEGQTPQTNPVMVPWDELPENLKESNRRQADHIGVNLETVNCGIVPLADWDATLFKFPPEEVERLAEMEHERWEEDCREEGWTYAPPPKDLEKKTSPWLIPWDELPDKIKGYDRDTVHGMPAFLARAGFFIYRLKEGGRG